MIVVVLLGLGLILGSFVNAMVWRFHAQAELAETGHKKGHPTRAELSMVKGRSMCSNCHHELAAKDLIPLLSWLYLRGKCRYCRRPIQDSPLIEIILPILFVISYMAWPYALQGQGLYLFIFWLFFLVSFIALAAYDLRWYILPDRIVFPLIGVAAIELAGRFIFFGAPASLLLGSAIAVAITSGIFYVLFQLSDGRWIGGGDVKLGIVLGLLAADGLQAALLLFIASLAGTLVMLPQLATGKANRSSLLPFGPFLLLATFIVVLVGQQLVTGYYRLLGLS